MKAWYWSPVCCWDAVDCGMIPADYMYNLSLYHIHTLVRSGADISHRPLTLWCTRWWPQNVSQAPIGQQKIIQALIGRQKISQAPIGQQKISQASIGPDDHMWRSCDYCWLYFMIWFRFCILQKNAFLGRLSHTRRIHRKKERKEIRSYEGEKNKKQHNCQAQSEHGWRFAAIRVSLTQAIGVWSDTRSVIGCPRRWITEMLPRARDPRRSDKEWERRGWELCEDKGMRTTKTAPDWVSRVRVHACPISPHRLCPSAIDTRGGPIGVDWERIVCNAYTPYLNPLRVPSVAVKG